MNTH